MQIRRCATGIEILAPAKVNLFFEVLDRRDDGYHEVETLMVPISVYDTLRFESAPLERCRWWLAGVLDFCGIPPKPKQADHHRHSCSETCHKEKRT